MEKQASRHAAIAEAVARWKGRVERPTGSGDRRAVQAIPTGFPTLDRATGIGGVPRGHLTLLDGLPTSGAGTLALKIAAEVTARSEPAAYVDLARTFDADYAVRCGVKPAHLVVLRPASLTDALDALPVLLGALSLVILDGGLSPAERVPRDVVRRLLATLRPTACALVVLGTGEADSLSEGSALRLALRRERWLERGRDVTGYRLGVQITRNRFAPAPCAVSLTVGFHGAVRGDGR